ncbi:hypothetical protein BD410DRAFT_836821 [Rickenella mellea]|uniref:Uncharacterized protein n=1 Tax=Rickenella mellea TaxID=50990 RepID=A0A4Y7QFN4_9AGAM|nr:hypothetical protein BD410DRAFT_836821 [Rickenella mellea]
MIALRHLFFLYVALTETICTAAAPVRDAPPTPQAKGLTKASEAIPPVKAVPVKVPPVDQPPTVAITTKTTLTKTSTSKAPVITTTALPAVTTSKTVNATASVPVTSSSAPIVATTSQPVKASAPVQVTSIVGATSESVNASASACPVKRSSVLENVQTRNVAARSLTSKEEHRVSLLRFKVGTDHEHWALFFHPSAPSDDGSFTGTRVDAEIVNANFPNAVLGTSVTQDKRFEPRDTAARTDTITTPATVANGAAAQKLVNKAGAVRLTQQPPTQNCVDFTHLAMQALSTVSRGFTAISADMFQPIFSADEEGVRERTDCNFTCRIAGEAD